MDAPRLFSMVLILFIFVTLGSEFSIPFPSPEEKVVYQTVREYVNRTVEVPVWNIPEQKITVQAVGIFQNTTKGELIGITLLLRGGNGSVYVDVGRHYFGTDFQKTLYMIKDYAESYTKQSLGFRDFIVNMDSSAVETIQGTSGSAAITVGLIALLQNKTLVPDVVISGTLKSDGMLGKVEALAEKAAVAKKNGVKKFLIPQSQCDDVDEAAGMEILCILDIEEAAGYMVA